MCPVFRGYPPGDHGTRWGPPWAAHGLKANGWGPLARCCPPGRRGGRTGTPRGAFATGGPRLPGPGEGERLGPGRLPLAARTAGPARPPGRASGPRGRQERPRNASSWPTSRRFGVTGATLGTRSHVATGAGTARTECNKGNGPLPAGMAARSTCCATSAGLSTSGTSRSLNPRG